jgi:hypothetical protein
VSSSAWDDGGTEHLGPVSTYMTPCGAGGCTVFNVSGAEWFKVDAEGWDGTLWAAQKLIAGER